MTSYLIKHHDPETMRWWEGLDAEKRGQVIAECATLRAQNEQITKWLDTGKAWSWIRSVLGQGQAQQADYASGKYSGYEAYSARVDEAAREREEELREFLGVAK